MLCPTPWRKVRNPAKRFPRKAEKTSHAVSSVTCSISLQPNCCSKPYYAHPVLCISSGMNPSQWHFAPESQKELFLSNLMPNTAFPTGQLSIAHPYSNPLHHLIAAQPSALTGSGPTSILTQPLQTAPSHSTQPFGNCQQRAHYPNENFRL